jgi:peroxiredoxin
VQADLSRFAALNAQVVGVNTDSVPCHIAFQQSLGGLAFPLASDRWPYAKTAEAYGIFPASKHPVPFFNDRAIFIVDKEGKIAWSKVYELREQPDDAEILEALRQLK